MVKNSLKSHGVIMIGLLTLQYILGMTANLFVTFPQNTSSGQMWAFAKLQVPIIFHILIGFCLLIGVIILLIRAIRNKDTQWILAAAVGNMAIFVAIISGILFIPSQVNVYSYVMSLSFILAFLSIGWGIYTSKQ